MFRGKHNANMIKKAQHAVVLLSGGIDSATTLAYAINKGYDTHALTIDYGQRHRVELQAARRVVSSLEVKDHKILTIDLRSIGGSALTADIKVPGNPTEAGGEHAIPPTYVPARNTVFLSLALGWAEVLDAFHIFIGVTAVDYSGYPDCRPEFIEAFEKLANLATKSGVEGKHFKIQAPLLQLSKSQILKMGSRLGVDYSLTHSCYDPTGEGLACGRCDSCRIRKRGFIEAGLPDPTRYAP